MFECDRCGLCCIGLNENELMADMHNGDGICRNLDPDTKNCRIYADRPIFCRVDEYYETYLADQMDHEEYMKLNYEACELKKREFEKCGRDMKKMAFFVPKSASEYDEVVQKSLEEAERERTLKML